MKIRNKIKLSGDSADVFMRAAIKANNTTEESQFLKAAMQMDWQQVVLNGGPPCFHLEDGRFCGRAERWFGHPTDHKYIPLDELLLLFAGQHDANKCYQCNIRPRRGGKRRGSALCDSCFNQ